MKEKIVDAITVEAVSRNCKILFAVESGSRAWGFASANSDYDVRAVYVKPIEWYLRLDEEYSDCWNVMLPNDLDICAWDMRKALRLFLKSNASFIEWINSPIIYQDTGLLSKLKQYINLVFNPIHVAFHYASMFRNAIGYMHSNGEISIKKLCYAIRANCAVKWIMDYGTMPPTLFSDIYTNLGILSKQKDAIINLLEEKEQSVEKDLILPNTTLKTLLVDMYDEIPLVCRKANKGDVLCVRNELEKHFISELGIG